MRRIYDSWDRAYKSVFGALRQNEPCTFTICLPVSQGLDTNPMLVLYLGIGLLVGSFGGLIAIKNYLKV